MRDDLDEAGTLGGFVPKFMEEKPELDTWTIYYLDAFYTLTNSRQTGMGLGNIPLSEITNYCDFFRVKDSDMFIKIIQSADRAFLRAYNEKKERDDANKRK